MAEKQAFFESELVKDFNNKIEKDHLGPLWSAIPELVSKEPKPLAVPYLWKWATLKEYLLEAKEIFTPERGGERRAIYLQNPGLKEREPWGWGAATQNLYAAVQLILPGEEAPSHRHTQSALRFIMDGEGAYSVINGERMFMNEGDFVVTPQGMWHGHGHEVQNRCFGWMFLIFLLFMRPVGLSLKDILMDWRKPLTLIIIPVSSIKEDSFVRKQIVNLKKHRLDLYVGSDRKCIKRDDGI